MFVELLFVLAEQAIKQINKRADIGNCSFCIFYFKHVWITFVLYVYTKISLIVSLYAIIIVQLQQIYD